MLKRHDLVQTPHEGDTEDGIGEATTHQRYAEHLDTQSTVEQDIVSTHIEGEEHQSEGNEFIHVPTHQFQPPQADQTTSKDARKRPLGQGLCGQVVIVHHLLIIDHLQYMLAGKQGLHHADEKDNRHHIGITPHGWLIERVGMEEHALQADGKGDDRRAADQAKLGRVPPVEPVAITEQPSRLKKQRHPEHTTQPVDATQGHYLGHRVDWTGKCRLDQKHQ